MYTCISYTTNVLYIFDYNDKFSESLIVFISSKHIPDVIEEVLRTTNYDEKMIDLYKMYKINKL